jgi:hypothetical protein
MTSPPILPLPTTLPFSHPSSDSTASSSADHHQPHVQHYPALRKVASLTLPSSVARAQLHRRMENKGRLRREKQGWMSEVASMTHVRPEHLLDRCWEDDDAEVDIEEEKLKRRKRAGRKSSVVRQTVAEQAYSSGSDDSTDDEEEAYDPHVRPLFLSFFLSYTLLSLTYFLLSGRQEPPPYHTFLVFSLPTLPSLLDTLISSYAPNAFPRAWRAAPANAIYLFARFALYRCDDDWLEELVVGVVDKVEKSVYVSSQALSSPHPPSPRTLVLTQALFFVHVRRTTWTTWRTSPSGSTTRRCCCICSSRIRASNSPATS